jgi:hypothetical protein
VHLILFISYDKVISLGLSSYERNPQSFEF